MRSFHVIIPLILFFQSVSIAETRETLWKKTFSKIFLKNIRKELSLNGQEQFVLEEAKKSLYFNSRPFSEVYEVLTNQESSLKAFEMRESLLSNKITFSQLLKWRIPKIRYKKAKNLVSKYNSYFQLDKHEPLQKNFFKRPIGKDLVKELKDTVFIVLSGYGSHLIDEPPFMETLREINTFYGRSVKRPKIKTFGKKTLFMPHNEFYQKTKKPIMMDIIYPMGDELGNTLGSHHENAKKLEKWIENLPKTYHNKNIVFIGYSKGLTLALELIKNSPHIQKRTKAIFSLSGPQQGSLNLRLLVKDLMKITGRQSLKEMAELAKNLELRGFLNILSSKINEKDKTEYQKLFKLIYLIKMGELPKSLLEKAENFLSEDSSIFFKGIIEQTPSYRLKWNLENLNDSHYKYPLSIFSVSFLTNVKDFFHKFDLKSQKFKFNNELVPRIRPSITERPFPIPSFDTGNSLSGFLNKVVYWKDFSLDSFILHLTSVAAFERSPGGLMDTQIAWGDSKSFFLDHRPLSYQFSKEELLKIYQNLDIDKKNLTFYEFLNNERRSLIPKGQRKNLNFVDLGELRGTHWNIPLTQAARIPGSYPNLGYVNSFPRKPLLISLLQTYALYKLEKNL
ncbi:MAG: hypothetical protein VYD54_00725 [Bdellovibrionota bacterium]|nr:hypothetical protein [Bdellovibrionota bacterium]